MPNFPRTLRFVESTGFGYSEYVNPDGDTVYVQDGTGNILVDFHTLDVYLLWHEMPRATTHPWQRDREAFLDKLRGMVTDPDEIESIAFCDDCLYPGDEESFFGTEDGSVCESCYSDYFYCNFCDEVAHIDNGVYVYDCDYVCSGCADHAYRYCDHCDIYVSEDDYEHDHNEDCDCESPVQTFTVNGLANDERVAVSLPAGTISEVGMTQIRLMIARQVLSDTVQDLPDDERAVARKKWWQVEIGFEDAIGDTWQGKQGNFTKRLSRYAYSEHGLKVPAQLLQDIGNVARQHSEGGELEVAVTRDLNLPAEEFAHEGSCWWTEYSESRCALKTNGGFGLRSFGDENAWGVTVQGRAWVMPLMSDGGGFRPTINAESPDAYLVFNGYGDLSGYAPARIMAQMTGTSYRKVAISQDPMYINGNVGYLVGSEDVVEGFTDGHVRLSLAQHAHLDIDENVVAEVAA